MSLKIYHFYGVTPQFYGIPSDKDYLTMNSVETHFWNYVLKRLKGTHGHCCEVQLFTDDKESKRVNEDGLDYVFHPRFHFPIKGFMEQVFNKFSRSYLTYLKNENPDLFVFYCGITPSHFPVVRLLKRLEIPFIIQYHGGNLMKARSFKEKYYCQAKWIIVPTQAVKEELLKRLPKVLEKKVLIIPCGINTEYYYKIDVAKEVYPRLCFSAYMSDRKSFSETLHLER